MKFRSLRYYIKEAFTNLFRNNLMTFASVATVASCIFILTVSFCVAANLDYILQQFGATIGFTVLLDEKITPAEVNDLYAKIAGIDHVSEVKYVSKDEALESLAEALNDTTGILAGLEKDNPLPRSFDIKVDDPGNQRLVVSKINELDAKGIEEIRHESEIVNVLITINKGIRIVSIFIILVLIVVSVVLIINTVKLTVNSRQTEINIMKYVGATDWFIRWPFIIEGILIGLVGALIPIAICWLSYSKIVDVVYANVKLLQNLITFRSAVGIFFFITPVSLIIGVVIGAVGSITSMRRHLKV